MTAPSRVGDTAEIASLYVHPDRWRSGAGTALMAASLAQLAGAGFETVTLVGACR